MEERTLRDYWIEMSIREIWTQTHFAQLAYRNLDPKAQANSDAVFSSIHSFLSHCAMVSKMLMATEQEEGRSSIGDILGIPASSLIHTRRFRNHLEHYDERLKAWIGLYGINANVGTYNVGPRDMIKSSNTIYVSHYDPEIETFTFANEEFDLRELFEEAVRIKEIADNWVQMSSI